jgi:hypothetical protein
MLRKSLLAPICATLFVVSAFGQTAPPALTNDDVISMFKGGLGESTIISAIQSQDTNFDISAMGLLQLKKSGVPPKIMDAVISAAGKHKAAVEAAAAAKAQAEAEAKAKATVVVPAVMTSPILPGTPSVLLVQAGQKQPLPIGHTQIIQTKAKPSSLAALTSDGSLAQAMAGASQSVAAAGMMKGSSKVASTAMMANPMIGGAMMAGGLFAHRKQAITDVWAVPGPKSEAVIHNAQPAFEVQYANVPGINADEYEPVLLKLEPTANNFRLVGATQAKPDALQASTADWGMYSSFVEERMPAQATKAAPGSYQLQASSALAPGEYAVALRPINKEKKFSGTSMTQNTGDGLLFNSVWSFEVQ